MWLTSGFASVRMLLFTALRFAPCFYTFLRFFYDFNFSRSTQCSNNTFLAQTLKLKTFRDWNNTTKKTYFLPPTSSSLHSGDRKTQLPTFKQRRKKMPLVESTCCMNCHRLLQRIAVFETKLLAGFPKQAEHTADGHHEPPQHTAGDSCESQQFISSVEEQAETDWHKQAQTETPRHSRHQIVMSISYYCGSILYPRYSYDNACKHWYSTTPIHLENRFEALMNVGEESQMWLNMDRISQQLVSASDITPTDRWLNVWCIQHT